MARISALTHALVLCAVLASAGTPAKAARGAPPNTNADVRACIDAVIAEDGAQCQQDLYACFQSDDCKSEFTDLFSACEVPNNDDAYTSGACMRAQSEKIILRLTKSFVACLDTYCGVLQDPASDVGGPQSTSSSSSQSQSSQSSSSQSSSSQSSTQQRETDAQRRKREEEDAFACLYDAIRDSGRCAQYAQECDNACFDDLASLKACMMDPKCKRGTKMQLFIDELQNDIAHELAYCLVQSCMF